MKVQRPDGIGGGSDRQYQGEGYYGMGRSTGRLSL